MTTEEHKERHINLHKSLDEIMSDYLVHNEDKRLDNTTLTEIMVWSHKQTQGPDHT